MQKGLYLLAALCIISCLPSVTFADPFVGIYGGGPFYDSLADNLDYLKSSSYTAVILWCVHVYDNGDLVYNGAKIVSDGQYVGDGNWPGLIAQLKSDDSTIKQIALSVGSAGVNDFTNIQNLMSSQGTGSDSILYRNFAALKSAIPSIDIIDMDDEDLADQNTIAQFSLLMGQTGFKVSMCAYCLQDMWIAAIQQVNSQQPDTVVQLNLQCYVGGEGNDPVQWQQAINNAGLSTPVIPGLWSGERSTDDVQNQFSGWRDQGISGGFMWLWDDMKNSNQDPASYARAIHQGIGA